VSVPAPAALAQTARTATIDTPARLAEGGSPADDDFNADACLAGMERLAALGVSWLQASLPGDSLAHVTETIERFRTLVIDASWDWGHR
jgi:hypothetical protein